MSDERSHLSIRNLKVRFGPGGIIPSVRGVSLDIRPGKTLCLVGESGSGKSVTSLAVMGLHKKTANITADEMRLGDVDLLDCSDRQMADLRGRELAMIFQDPMTSLNPSLTIGYQLAEAMRLHERVSNRAARDRALSVLQSVRIPDAARRLDAYPHQLSGGMRQRVMIAMALMCRPKLLIADEPTTALDVTVQAQILWLLQELQREAGTAIMFITHDLGVVAEIADEVAVMYAGKIVEQARSIDLFDRPAHGYTVGLLGSTLDFRSGTTGNRLVEIPGTIPKFSEWGQGCDFVKRCRFAAPSCEAACPPPILYDPRHIASCDQVRSAPDLRETSIK
jgi:oligopeptide/dipeptide ABC transporter ATP-binding protein